MKNLYVVIPSYWQGNADRIPQADDLVFDHPTFLDGPDTLTASLDSLAKTDAGNPFRVLVLTAAVDHSLDEAAAGRVNEIISAFKGRLDIGHFHAGILRSVQDTLEGLGFGRDALSLEGYSAIRNCQLAIPAILGADIISAIDDDELVERNYPERVLAYVGNPGMDGIAGRYRYGDGRTLVHDRAEGLENPGLFISKQTFQNQVYKAIEASPETIVDTSIVLGGNMVFSRKLFMHVPFDPLVCRGEDIDYMINSRMAGYSWKLDKDLLIDHFPPPCKETNKLQEDVMRFIYEREKIRRSRNRDGVFPVRAEELGAYPGNFLKDNLEEEALAALRERPAGIESESWYASPEEVIRRGRQLASKVDDYFTFAERWPGMMEALCADLALQDELGRMFK